MGLFRAEHTVDQVLDGSPEFTGTPIFDQTPAIALPNANVVIAGTLDVAGATTLSTTLGVTGKSTLTGGIVGTTAGGNAAAGNVGEVISGILAVGSPVALTTATPANVLTIVLTAGDWDVEGNLNFVASGATTAAGALYYGGISTATGTVPTDGTAVIAAVPAVTTTAFGASITLPRKRISVAGNTNVFLVGLATFSAGTVGGYGAITARRVR
jgi:hypothetical protein